MAELPLHQMKGAILGHVESVFGDIEEMIAIKHQEKFALLEDACENATDVDELRVAFEKWFAEHVEDLELDQSSHDLWEDALSNIEDEDFSEF